MFHGETHADIEACVYEGAEPQKLALSRRCRGAQSRWRVAQAASATPSPRRGRGVFAYHLTFGTPSSMPKRTDISSILDHRRRPDRHRPGGGVRLFGEPGGQGAEGRGLSGDRRQFEPGDDHDRSRAGGRDLHRADHRPRSSPRSSRRSGPTRCCRRWAGRPRSTPR